MQNKYAEAAKRIVFVSDMGPASLKIKKDNAKEMINNIKKLNFFTSIFVLIQFNFGPKDIKNIKKIKKGIISLL